MLIRFIFQFLFIRQAAFQNFLPLINGKPVDIKERPYQVAINVNYVPFFKADCFCGGAIISANYILTAAHTFHNKDYTFVARVGTSDCTWWGTVYYIKDNGIIFHPEFKAEPRLINDLAILEMATEIKFTNEIPQPIVMASADFSTSNAFVEISGYGRTCFGMDCPESKQLEKIEVNTLTFDECRKYHANILPNMICHIDQNRRWTSIIAECLTHTGSV